MIPFLYDESEVYFTGAGLGRLVDCISCRVTEERNSIFECEFQYPVNGTMFKEIKPGRIVCVSHDVNGDMQPFDIYAYRIDLDGVATFYARHITYRLNFAIVDYFQLGKKEGGMAYTWGGAVSDPSLYWINRLPYKTNFTMSTIGDEIRSKWLTLSRDRCGTLYTVRDLLIGDKNSIISETGGEITWDKFAVSVNTRRGTDTTAIIRAGLNLNSVTYEYDEGEKADGIAPYYTVATSADSAIDMINAIVYLNGNNDNLDSEGNPTGLDQYAIEVPDNLASGATVRLVPVDLTSEFGIEPTQGDLYNKVIEKYNSLAMVKPRENLTITFRPLWESPEYPNIAPAEKLKLCDTAIVVVPDIGLAKRMKVVKVVWDALLERYVSMEFGSLQRTIYGVDSIGGTPEEDDQDIVDIPPDTPVP